MGETHGGEAKSAWGTTEMKEMGESLEVSGCGMGMVSLEGA